MINVEEASILETRLTSTSIGIYCYFINSDGVTPVTFLNRRLKFRSYDRSKAGVIPYDRIERFFKENLKKD